MAAKGSLPSAIAMFEATMEALIGLVPASALHQPPVWRCAGGGRGGPALSAQPCRAAIPAADRTGTDGTGGRRSLVAGHPLQLMIFIMGSVGLPLVIAGSGRQLGWLPEQAAPFSAR